MTNLIVVEDDLLLSESLTEMLHELGYRVASVKDGGEALALIDGGNFQVLVTDIRIPGSLDGWDVALKARDISPHIGVLYMSGQSDAPERKVQNGVFIQKPFTLESLHDAVLQVTALSLLGSIDDTESSA